jgi:hypothetical protein
MIDYIFLGIIFNVAAFIIDFVLTAYLVFSISHSDKLKLLKYMNDLKENNVIHPYKQMILFLLIPFYGVYLTIIHIFFIVADFD